MSEKYIAFNFAFLGRQEVKAAYCILMAVSAYLQKCSHYAAEILYDTIS